MDRQGYRDFAVHEKNCKEAARRKCFLTGLIYEEFFNIYHII
jgi:hypothetical protein